MKLLKLAAVISLVCISGCLRQAPMDWMLAERDVFKASCTEDGLIVQRKFSTASETMTWSCAYPKNYEKWLFDFDKKFVLRGWYLFPGPNVDWQTYCHKEKHVNLRLGKVNYQDNPQPKLWISLRYPADTCPKPVELEKSK